MCVWGGVCVSVCVCSKETEVKTDGEQSRVTSALSSLIKLLIHPHSVHSYTHTFQMNINWDCAGSTHSPSPLTCYMAEPD